MQLSKTTIKCRYSLLHKKGTVQDRNRPMTELATTRDNGLLFFIVDDESECRIGLSRGYENKYLDLEDEFGPGFGLVVGRSPRC